MGMDSEHDNGKIVNVFQNNMTRVFFKMMGQVFLNLS